MTLLIEGIPDQSDSASELMTCFFDDLTRDYSVLLPNQHNIVAVTGTEHLRQYLLADLDSIAKRLGASLKTLSLPEVSPEFLEDCRRRCAVPVSCVSVGTLESNRVQYEELLASITNFPEQAAVLDAVRTAWHAEQPKCVFIDGPAGRGKTHVLLAIASMIRANDLEGIVIAAFTGIAAIDHIGGRTMHKTYGLPVDIGQHADLHTLTSSLKMGSPEAGALRAAAVVVLDELPMCNAVYLMVVDKLLRTVMSAPDVPFGGKVVVAAGDFRQTAPVVPRANREQVLQASVKSCEAWRDFTVMSLTVPIRAASDSALDRFLETLGNGTAAHVDRATGRALPDQDKRLRFGGEHYVALHASSVLGQRLRVFTDPKDALEFTHSAADLAREDYGRTAPPGGLICPHNDTVDEHNLKFLAQVPGPPVYLDAIENMQLDSEAEHDFMSDEFMAHVHEGGKPPHRLTLKVGAIVQAIRNMNSDTGVLNGTRLCIVGIKRHVVLCEFLDGSKRRVAIPRLLFEINIPKSVVKVQRRQFPLRLCYAITSNKAQGKTFTGNVCVDMRRGFFAHGQLYVAMSRSVCAERLALLVNPHDVVVDPDSGEKTTVFVNVVYPELLSTVIHGARDRVPRCATSAMPPMPTTADARARMEWEHGYSTTARGPRTTNGTASDRRPASASASDRRRHTNDVAPATAQLDMDLSDFCANFQLDHELSGFCASFQQRNVSHADEPVHADADATTNEVDMEDMPESDQSVCDDADDDDWTL
jgi:hypothetical protein